MKRFTIISILILVITGAAHAGKPGPVDPCAGETPLSWSFTDITNAAFLSDGNGAYQQNVDGVYNSLLQSEDFSATITLGATRRIRVQVPSPVAVVTGVPPSFAGGASFLSGGQMNIRNIIGDPYPAPIYPNTFVFYTKASGRFYDAGGKTWQWAAVPHDDNCPVGLTCVTNTHGETTLNLNVPEQTGWVKVTYIPRDRSQAFSSSNAERWLVEGTFVEASGVVQRTTLWDGARKSPHQGQYSMPFSIEIKALCPLP